MLPGSILRMVAIRIQIEWDIEEEIESGREAFAHPDQGLAMSADGWSHEFCLALAENPGLGAIHNSVPMLRNRKLAAPRPGGVPRLGGINQWLAGPTRVWGPAALEGARPPSPELNRGPRSGCLPCLLI